MKLLTQPTNFDFLGKKAIFFTLSAILISASIWVWFSQGAHKYGVDFLGGHEFVVQFPAGTDAQSIRETFAKEKMDDIRIQSFEKESNEFSIRLNSVGDDSAKVKQDLLALLKKQYGETVQIVKSDFVGPTVGAELRKKALVAIGLGLLCMLVYVALRFEFAFGLGAVVAVFHDVIVAGGVYLLCGRQVNMATLAGALTIVGYSMNDTIVIFDRVREELFRNRDSENLSTLVNRSINFTLSRTMITHFLTMFAVLSLLVFGGPGELRDMSTFLFAGMVSGAYSTIYIAAPVMIWWHKLRGGTEKV